jgi:hypothetical protein
VAKDGELVNNMTGQDITNSLTRRLDFVVSL